MNRSDLEGMTKEELIRRVEYVEGEWQRAADNTRKYHPRGYPPRPKRRGEIDIVSVRQAAKDTGKAAKFGGTVGVGNVALWLWENIDAGHVEVVPWNMLWAETGYVWLIIGGLLVGYFLFVLSLKALEVYN
jgi:hypothetical protein